jgi:hypothetical protein
VPSHEAERRYHYTHGGASEPHPVRAGPAPSSDARPGLELALSFYFGEIVGGLNKSRVVEASQVGSGDQVPTWPQVEAEQSMAPQGWCMHL